VYTNAMRLSSWTSPRRDRREQLVIIFPYKTVAIIRYSLLFHVKSNDQSNNYFVKSLVFLEKNNDYFVTFFLTNLIATHYSLLVTNDPDAQ
jgi:hypothetical protein